MIKKGFTLVELLAVFVLLAIIFMIAVPNVFKLISKGKSNAFLVSVRQVYKAGNIYRLNELREREEECVYFDFGEDYQIDTLVNSKMYIPIEELELQGDLPKEGVMEVCQDFVSITVSDGDNTVDIGPDGDEHVFDGNLEESNVSRPVIDNISTSKTTKSITTTVTAHDDKNDIVKYYYYLNGDLKQSINDNLYEFTNIKDNTSYKIKIVVENGKGLKTSQNINVKTDEVPLPEITVDKTGWQQQKKVTITYPSGNNLSYQYKINSGEITGNYEKETWITPALSSYKRYITVTYTSEGSVSAKVSDGFNEKVVTYNVIEVDGVKPEVTIEPTIVEGENDWVTMASIKGTITKKGPSSVKLYRCLSSQYVKDRLNEDYYLCSPTSSENNVVEDGSSLVLSSNYNYQKVCYRAKSETGVFSNTVCSDIYRVDTKGPTITANVSEAKLCNQSEEKWKDNVTVSSGVSGLKSEVTCGPAKNEINSMMCEVTGNNGKTASTTIKIKPIGCYVNYNPDNATWDVTRDGVQETAVNEQGIFNIYNRKEEDSESGSVNGQNKKESITCNNSCTNCNNSSKMMYNNYYDGWRVMNIDKTTGQITLIHGGTPECYYHAYGESVASKEILKVKATSASNEGTGKAWTKYGNSELAESVHYMDNDDVNKILYEENGNEDYNMWDYLDKGERGNCYYGNNCGYQKQLISTNSFYWVATAYDTGSLCIWYAYRRFTYGTGFDYNYNSIEGVRPVIVLKPNVKLGQESGLKGDEYNLVTS